jgi:hypothetical protein
VDVLFTPSARVQFLSAVETIRRNNRDAARKSSSNRRQKRSSGALVSLSRVRLSWSFDASRMARGIMWVMMSGAAAGCQADRARGVALGLGTGGGQSIPAANAAYLNVAFRSMLTPCRVGSAVTSSARGIEGGPRPVRRRR